MRLLLTVATGLARAGAWFARTHLAALLVWFVFWGLLAATAQFSVGLAFPAGVAGYIASRCVWGRWRCKIARGAVALAVAGLMLAPYWRLISH